MAIVSKKVYLTPNLIFAFIDRGSAKHEMASAYFRFFAEKQYALFIDAINVMEAYDMVYKKMSPSMGRDFLRVLFLSDINIIYPEESDIKVALKALTGYKTAELSFSEAVMSTLANKRNISTIATFEFLHPLFGLQVFYLPI
ncbi:MAG: hypothetical protein ACM3IJ_04430 [Candidatus Levyibacteriota bacterium]